MRESFVRIRNSLNPKNNTTRFMNFYNKKQNEQKFIEDNYGCTTETKNLKEQSNKNNQFGTTYGQNSLHKQKK